MPEALSNAAPPGRRGPSEDRGVVEERILVAARASFAAEGWAGTSMRAVARAAGVDPRAVTYYFTDKATLLDACLAPPEGFFERIGVLMDVPVRRRGAALVASVLNSWETPSNTPILRSIVLTAAHMPTAMDRLRRIFQESLVAAVADSLDDEQRHVRAGLVCTQIVGLFMTRYVWRIEPIASLPAEDVVSLVGPTVQRYLSGSLAPQGPT
ncbi:MAG: TetR family transcriptional regulator [Propionibacteriaceae bacterium]